MISSIQIVSQTGFIRSSLYLPASQEKTNRISSFYQKGYEVIHAEERLFHIKTQEILQDLTQIMSFIVALERLGFKNPEVVQNIHEIIRRLQSGEKDYKYTKIVHILTKYLSGIRNLSSTMDIEGVVFYKKLFESTLVAIIRELDYLEMEVL